MQWWTAGGQEASPTDPPSPNDDQRLYFGYRIGRKIQVPSKHIIIVNWGHHAAKRSAELCAQAIAKLLTTENVPHPLFCRVCSSKTCLSFVDLESATLAYAVFTSHAAVTTLGRKIVSAYSSSKMYEQKAITHPRAAVSWATYDQESKRNDGSGTKDIPHVPGLLLVLDALNSEQEQRLVKELYTNGESGLGWSSCARKVARERSDFSMDDHRRVMHFGHKFDYDTRGVGSLVTGGSLPPFLQTLAELVREYCGGHDANGEDIFDQCTVNEYKAGHGIAAHVDTHSAFGTMLVSLSLLNASVMSFVHSVNGKRMDLILPPRSLLILQGEARYVWTHCIPPRTTDLMEGGELVRRETRLSLTLRRLRRSEEGPCTCRFGGAWCDSLAAINSEGKLHVDTTAQEPVQEVHVPKVRVSTMSSAPSSAPKKKRLKSS
jgi:alkylated DNA repair dioxygenase AlkB